MIAQELGLVEDRQAVTGAELEQLNDDSLGATVRGVSVPTIGIGVFEVDPGETEETIADAIAAGYRHVDTAVAYGRKWSCSAAWSRT